MMKNRRRQKIIILGVLVLGFLLVAIPNTSFADRFDDLNQLLEEGKISEQDYNRLYQEEQRAQRLQNDIDYIKRQLQDPNLTPEQKQELEAQLASKRQEIRTLGRTIDEHTQTAQEKPATGKCFSLWNFSLEACVEGVISAVGEFLKQIFGLVLWLAGKFFDKSVEYSVASFSTLADSDSIKIGWKTLRDVANLFFIFILLYAAIGMILQLPSVNGKRILVSVIVVALLINFSAFFTRLVIDASNVAANQFYNAVSKSETARIGVGEGQLTVTGISATFMNALPIHSVLAGTPGRTIINSVGISFGAVIMMLVAIFIFLAAAILFVIRTVTLLFVIILSPLAFLMYAFPNQKGLFDKWLDTLLKQAFFAPLYLLMVWVTIKFLKGGALQAILAQEGSSPVLITLNFLIAIGFMFGAIIIAKSLGAKGASAAMKGAGALTGAATGMVGGATKYGLRKLGAGAGWVGGKVGQKAPRVASTLKTISGGVGKTVKAVEKAVPGVSVVRKGITEIIKSPLKATAEGLAKVTKDYGVGGILGRTKDEEADARKKEREEKEAAREKELKSYAEELKNKTLTKERAAEILGKMKSKEISKLDKAALKNPSVIHNLNSEDLKAMNREGVDREVMKEIYANIVGRGKLGDKDYLPSDENHPAYKYAAANPFGRRGGIATPPTDTSSQPETPPKPTEPRPQVPAIVAPVKPEKPRFEI